MFFSNKKTLDENKIVESVGSTRENEIAEAITASVYDDGCNVNISPTITFFNVMTDVGIIQPFMNSFLQISDRE